MNEKLSNYTDQRIRDAAKNMQQSYDERSWERIEALLDDKKKRPFIFWFYLSGILLLILSWGIYTYFSSQPVDKIAVNTNAASGFNSGSVLSNPHKVNEKNQNGTVMINNDNSVFIKKSIKTDGLKVSLNSEQDERLIIYSQTKDDTDLKSKRKSKKVIKGKLVAGISQSDIEKEKQNEAGFGLSANETFTSEPNPVINDSSHVKINEVVNDIIDNVVKVDSVHHVDSARSEKDKSPVKKVKKWYLIAGGGVESSNVKFFSFKNGVVVPRFGFGIGFRIYKNLDIQTGFYVSGKKYVAGPRDYKPSSGSYWSNVQIIKADANCLVYDIPVSLRYNLSSSKIVRTFFTAGLHSYIMKNESYDYEYIANNYTYNKTYSYTGNKGFFGVFSFSAGFEKQLNERFSIIGEPYLTIPLKGVGEGHVKLFSTGIQTLIKYSF